MAEAPRAQRAGIYDFGYVFLKNDNIFGNFIRSRVCDLGTAAASPNGDDMDALIANLCQERRSDSDARWWITEPSE